MRLIDVNKLIRNIARIEDMRRLSTKTIGEAIDATPVIDAIPRDWIEKEIKTTEQLCGQCKYHEALSLMLSNWEEDNEDLVQRRGARWNL